MSKRTIEQFFPSFVKFLTAEVPYGSSAFHDVLFPDAAARACPEPSVSMRAPSSSILWNDDDDDVVAIRQPALLLAATVGLVIGFCGAVRLRRMKVSCYWTVSYAAFGIMNLSAVWVHCLLPAPEEHRSYPETYPLLWMVDTYMTGVAASSLAVACSEASRERTTDQPSNSHYRCGLVFWTLQGLGLASAATFVWRYTCWVMDLVRISILSAVWRKTREGRMPLSPPGMDGTNITDALEAWYLLPPLHATIAASQLLFGPIVVWDPSSTKRKLSYFPHWNRQGNGGQISRRWTSAHVLFLASIVCPTLLGIGLDRFWCWAIHSRENGGTFFFLLWDLLSASAMTFLGCDLAYLAIFLWLHDNSEIYTRE